MPVLMTAVVRGEPEDLAARYARQQPLLLEEFGGPPPGYLFHACAKTDAGLSIVNLVDSEETVWQTRPRFAKTAEAVGLPEPEIELHPVENALGREFGPTMTRVTS